MSHFDIPSRVLRQIIQGSDGFAHHTLPHLPNDTGAPSSNPGFQSTRSDDNMRDLRLISELNLVTLSMAVADSSPDAATRLIMVLLDEQLPKCDRATLSAVGGCC
jgi:hypothetical protein